MANILGVGIATLDIINFVDHYPQEDEEMRAQSQRISRGGNVTNTLSVLSQYSHQCTWAGLLAKDNNAKYIVDELKKNNVQLEYCQQYEQGKTPTSYITLNQQNGSRTIVHYRDLPELSFSQFKNIPLEKFDWIHFEARDISENRKMIDWVKENNSKIPVSIEIEKPRANIEDIFQSADLYLYSKNFANLRGYSNAKDFLEHQSCFQKNKDLICAWGEQGAYALTSKGEFIHQSAYKVNNLVDTIGAGDTFNAGIINARLNKLSWQESLDQANQLAAKKCEQYGFDNLINS